jgi:hypothetical protein
VILRGFIRLMLHFCVAVSYCALLLSSAMKTTLFLLIGSLSLLSSFINPNQPNAGYFAMDPAQAEANRQNTHRIEHDSQNFRHRERMSEATAIEKATRNMPRSVSTTNVYAPRYGW